MLLWFVLDIRGSEEPVKISDNTALRLKKLIAPLLVTNLFSSRHWAVEH